MLRYTQGERKMAKDHQSGGLPTSLTGSGGPSSESESSGSVVLRLTHEKRSREEKNAETTDALTQLASESKDSRDMMLVLLALPTASAVASASAVALALLFSILVDSRMKRCRVSC
ncbi:hypothetical protein HS088_TW16G00796 [Tripterygium wilfordii]|uniref:Uncharacterized protein n=1 Tax=Tripterygium wilfordii TaxID=458696 RepID=A0A7J7CJV0_TRIWF|nr:hypothetical protein HS088_TW16G00796 [Tripterygium wilfordii]